MLMQTHGCVYLGSMHVVLREFGWLKWYYLVNSEVNRLREEYDCLLIVLDLGKQARQVESNFMLWLGEQDLSEHGSRLVNVAYITVY